MFKVDFERTDKLMRSVFAERPLPTERQAVWERTRFTEVIIEDYFQHYRAYIKELCFAGQSVYNEGEAARDYIYAINRRIINESKEKDALYEEIQQDPRYRKNR